MRNRWGVGRQCATIWFAELVTFGHSLLTWDAHSSSLPQLVVLIVYTIALVSSEIKLLSLRKLNVLGDSHHARCDVVKITLCGSITASQEYTGPFFTRTPKDPQENASVFKLRWSRRAPRLRVFHTVHAVKFPHTIHIQSNCFSKGKWYYSGRLIQATASCAARWHTYTCIDHVLDWHWPLPNSDWSPCLANSDKFNFQICQPRYQRKRQHSSI